MTHYGMRLPPMAVAISQLTAPWLSERGLELASEARKVDRVLARPRRRDGATDPARQRIDRNDIGQALDRVDSI